jgi:hypothetical protein
MMGDVLVQVEIAKRLTDLRRKAKKVKTKSCYQFMITWVASRIMTISETWEKLFQRMKIQSSALKEQGPQNKPSFPLEQLTESANIQIKWEDTIDYQRHHVNKSKMLSILEKASQVVVSVDLVTVLELLLFIPSEKQQFRTFLFYLEMRPMLQTKRLSCLSLMEFKISQ